MIEQPVTVQHKFPGSDDRTKTTHPAYGQIVAHRVSGHTNLYGSDFRHNGFITVAIRRSELHRDLSTDWFHANDELIEVALSEAQWATFVSAMNIGEGVPCTLRHIDNEAVPQLPDPISRADQFADEMKSTVESSVNCLKNLADEVSSMGLPKRKEAQLIGAIAKSIQEINRNAPFVAKCFDEHVENGIEAAKSEIHGYMLGAIQRSGLAVLAGESGPLLLESDA